ncbi:MAG: hypothetical protein AAFN74_25795, partial [Myxococcota bacterium]
MSTGTGAQQVDGRLLWAEVRKWLVEKSEWQSFADRVYSIDPGDAPFLSYFSVDFTPQSIES